MKREGPTGIRINKEKKDILNKHVNKTNKSLSGLINDYIERGMMEDGLIKYERKLPK